MTVFWLILFVVLAIIEFCTINLVSIWFSLGSVITCFISLVIDNFMIQIAVFTISSIILLLITKPLLRKVKNKEITPTNLDQVIGKVGVVTETIEKNEIGEVKVLGKRWSAYSDLKIEKDCMVKVLAINGVKLKVQENKESD